MPLTIPNPPDGTAEIIQGALTELQYVSGASQDSFGTPVEPRIDLAAPHPVYSLSANEVAVGARSAAAKLVGWRYILLEGETAVAAATVAPSENSGETIELLEFNRGPFVQETVEAVRTAENLPAAQLEGFEVRLLEVPEIYIVALWLHGRANLFLAMGEMASQSRLERLTAYPEQDFFTILQQLAAERQAQGETDGH